MSITIVHGGWSDPPGYYYGEAMAGPLCRDCHRDAGYIDDPESQPIPYDGESDTPTHCQGCDALIVHALTPDGIEYVRDALTDAVGRSDVLAAWREAYGDLIHDDEGGDA